MDDPQTSAGRSSTLLWSAVFAPGLICVALGVFVIDSTLLVIVGIALLITPLAVQLFGPDWDRETIPEGHHHDHHAHGDDGHAHPHAEAGHHELHEFPDAGAAGGSTGRRGT